MRTLTTRLARILSGLKATIARIVTRDRRHTEAPVLDETGIAHALDCLEHLLSLWRAGTLPASPMPSSPGASPMPSSPPAPLHPRPGRPLQRAAACPASPSPDFPVDPSPDFPVDPSPDFPVDPSPDFPVDPCPILRRSPYQPRPAATPPKFFRPPDPQLRTPILLRYNNNTATTI